MVAKLEKVAAGLDPSAAASSSPGAAKVDSNADVVMKPAGKAGKQGVIRKIGKDKTKSRANKALLKLAKQQGVIHDIKLAKQLLEGKKKRKTRPDGGELKRDKRIRKARERRERKGCGKSKQARELEEGDSEES